MELKKQGVKNFEVTAMLDWLVDPLLMSKLKGPLFRWLYSVIEPTGFSPVKSRISTGRSGPVEKDYRFQL
jgi:hypothetical protein